MDYDNNSGLGSAVMSVLGWIPQDEFIEASIEDGIDTIDEMPSVDIDSVIGDEEDENGSDCTDIDSESDFDTPPMSPISESLCEVEADTEKDDYNPLSVTVCAHPTNGHCVVIMNLKGLNRHRVHCQDGMALNLSVTILIRMSVPLSADWTRKLIHFTIFNIMQFWID